MHPPLPTARDRLLFTPGPLTTSLPVKQAMLRDFGSRDADFIAVIAEVRAALLQVAGVSTAQGYEAVLMQGSGTFAIEAVVSSAIAPDGKLLVVANGAYGERIARIAAAPRIATTTLSCEPNQQPDVVRIEQLLADDPAITDVAVVHCETTSGIMNPIGAIGQLVKQRGKTYLVDSMSAFGAVPFDFEACQIDYLVSSANKCLEGVPGFAFVICRRAALAASAGRARTLSLDLYAQWRGLEANGQFRFTPPTHAILACRQALRELESEGGVAARAARYRHHHALLVRGMRELGFQPYVPPALQGWIITSFLYPRDPRFEFEDFYTRLSQQGYLIYPGKVSQADCFRIGNIGRLFAADIQALLAAIRQALDDMGIALPLSTQEA
ncbi:MAG: 2-aminoethylphosphonate--pyruvate transaminase [Planctomycetes bacterium RBG_16_64_10]|nr:MAG: 2-aminoethylphosphonate--pyruvate transaminase [Planctomycetes bacterium RBG_16_64_10]